MRVTHVLRGQAPWLNTLNIRELLKYKWGRSATQQSIRLASTNKAPNNMELTTFLPWTVTGWEWPKENVKHRLRNSAGQKWFWKGFLWRRGEGGEKGKGGKGEEEVLTCHYLIGIFVIFWSKAYASRTNFLWYLHHDCFSLNACQRSLIVAQPIRNLWTSADKEKNKSGFL